MNLNITSIYPNKQFYVKVSKMSRIKFSLKHEHRAEALMKGKRHVPGGEMHTTRVHDLQIQSDSVTKSMTSMVGFILNMSFITKRYIWEKLTQVQTSLLCFK